MKGVIYARYSSDNQREESIEGQLRECKEYAERNDITILGTYIDRALSAKTDNRPEFQHMIKESAKGLFDVVLVWKLDRFARNRYDSARYKNLLKKNGVKVISARENISEGSEGIILEAMLEGYAEYYSAELSEKVIRGLTDNALKCKYNGGTVPMGYYIDEQQYYQIDPKTAPVVLEMFTKYSEGATMQELVNLLNSRGMRSIRGGKITLNIMNHLLKNRRYMGEYSYRDVVKENGIPAIVPKELFERVQERLAKNKKAPARHKAEDDYLLTTKLYCGKCGSFMVGESGTSHTMKVHRYYRCVNTKKKKLCDKKAVKKDWIEDLVVNYTMKAIMNDEVMERLIDTLMELQKKESTDLPLLKKQLAETEKGINNMLNAIQAGIFTPSTKQRLDELEETKSQLEVSILQEEMHKPLLTREQIAFFIYRFRKFDVTKREQRQRLIDSFVNAVYLYEDKIILTFNYKDGSKTITLAEVEGSDLSVLGAPYRVVIRDFPYDHSIFYVWESSSPPPGGEKPSLALGIKIVYDKLEGRSSLPSSFMIGGPAHDDTEKGRPAAGADHRLLGLLLLPVRPGPGGDAALCPVCHAVFAGLCAAGHCSVSQAAAYKPQDPAVGGPGGAFPYPHLYRRHRRSAVYLHLQCRVYLLPAGGDHTPFDLFAVPEKAGAADAAVPGSLHGGSWAADPGERFSPGAGGSYLPAVCPGLRHQPPGGGACGAPAGGGRPAAGRVPAAGDRCGHAGAVAAV